MRFTRHFTKPNLPIEQQIQWKTTSSKIQKANGDLVFEMKNVEVPSHWSQQAVNILAQKYFRKAGVPSRTTPIQEDNIPLFLCPAKPIDWINDKSEFGSERSAKQVFHRLAGAWTYWGWKEGIFKLANNPNEWSGMPTISTAEETNARIFYDEIYYMLAHQHAAPNSPQWFNTGLNWAYGIKGDANGQWICDENGPTLTSDSYTNPQPHACFIQPISDNLVEDGGIFDLLKKEARLFKHGSGTGTNFSNIRGKGEKLAGGGVSSGLMLFLKIFDTGAGAISSGGTCLAPDQYVYTEIGPRTVKELADSNKNFIALSYDPPAHRYKAKKAHAWKSGRKKLVLIITDKGSFKLSKDHPVLLEGNIGYVEAGNLRQGQSILACTIDDQNGYLRVGLHDGNKGKEVLHRLIAKDILGWNIEGNIVHHKQEDSKYNCRPDNLELLSQNEHAYIHGKALVATGQHIFQAQRFNHTGEDNGMHKDSTFWQDEVKVDSYKLKQSNILKSRGDASNMQENAASQKMLNLVFKVNNMGGNISSLELYLNSRERLIGKIGDKRKIRQAVTDRFGSWNNLIQEMNERNHKVLSIQSLGMSDVYDVEIDCPTMDDKTINSGHNFVIWPNSSFTGSGIAVSNTRRAAKMVCLNPDHPEIEEFIDWKMNEEYKAASLYVGDMVIRHEAGFRRDEPLIPQAIYDRLENEIQTPVCDLDFEGEAINTVSAQNANNSIRITNDFLIKVDKDSDWNLTARKGGGITKTLKAKKLWQKIIRAAWACGDPGLQFHDTINLWHTCKNDGQINASNPCSEYMFLDDTACNLASLNLGKFLKDGEFQTNDFIHATRLWTIVLEISVYMASFPSKEIAQNSYNYRTLGLGYANLGGILMRLGLSYDSDEGRNLASWITALLHGQSYLTSQEMANELSPFPKWEDNSSSMSGVISKHAEAVYSLKQGNINLYDATITTWDKIDQFGAFRNAQVTLTAPTGTISLLMDCDTSGIEPDFSLIKYKNLSGGGMMQIVNECVPEALKTLGYTPEQIHPMLKYIEDYGNLEDYILSGGDFFPENHLKVFDCANPSGTGTRSLRPLSHVLMMAAVQPFLSGAISKTCNLPNDATIQDVDFIYREAHRLGLKAIAIYRDGSKLTQPLSSKKEEIKPRSKGPSEEEWKASLKFREAASKKEERHLTPSEQKVMHKALMKSIRLIAEGKEQEFKTHTPHIINGKSAPDLPPSSRSHLPMRRNGYRQKVKIDGQSIYLATGEYPDGNLGEVWIEIAQEGSTLRSLLGGFSKAISISLQYGVPLQEFIDAFTYTKFEPAGIVEGHDKIKMVTSVLDFVFKELAIHYLGQNEFANIEPPEPPIYLDLDQLKSPLPLNENTLKTELVAYSPPPKPIIKSRPTGNPCPNCGHLTLIQTGSCTTCTTCGNNSGCG